MQLRDYLVNKKLAGTTVRRNVGCVRTIINFAMSEYSLEMNNPFHNLFIEKQARTVRRLPVPLDRLIVIQQECMEIADEIRLLILLLSGSLMRLSEAAGLLQEDIVMKGDMMIACIRPNKLRDLKTRSSERQIPLVGLARHAVEVLLCNKSRSLFPTMVGNELNGNSVSAAVNKWLKPRVVKGVTAHSFRHKSGKKVQQHARKLRDIGNDLQKDKTPEDAQKIIGEGFRTLSDLFLNMEDMIRRNSYISASGSLFSDRTYNILRKIEKKSR